MGRNSKETKNVMFCLAFIYNFIRLIEQIFKNKDIKISSCYTKKSRCYTKVIFVIMICVWSLFAITNNEEIYVPFISIILLLFILHYIIKKFNKNSWNHRIKILRDQKNIRYLINLIIFYSQQHIKVLYRKEQTLINKDEYGIIDDKKWEMEERYFFDNALLPLLQNTPKYHSILETIKDNIVYGIKQIYHRKYGHRSVWIEEMPIITCSMPHIDDIIDGVRIYNNIRGDYKNFADIKILCIHKKIYRNNGNYSDLNIQYNKYSDIKCMLFEYFKEIYIYLSYEYKKINKYQLNLPKTGIEFENEVCLRLKEAGYESILTKTSYDQGVDVIIIKDNIKIAIQCKLYTKPVGNKAVQEIIAGKDFYNADYGVVVSNASFTNSAIELANKCGIKLINFDSLEEDIDSIFKIKF